MQASLQLLRCHVDSSAYGFDATRVQGVHRWESVASRHAPEPVGCIGLLDQRPVFPLTFLLGLDEEAAPSQGPVLLLDGFAVQVDRVSRPAQVPVSEFRRLPLPVRHNAGRVQGLARIDGELTLCLSADGLGPVEERSQSEAFPAWPADEPWLADMGGDTGRLLCFLPPGADDKAFFAVSYRQVAEIAQNLTLTRMRTANPCLAGLVNWRDRAVPVVDLAALVGVGPAPKVDVSRVLIARSPRTSQLFAFPASHLAPVSLPLPEDSTVSQILQPPTAFIRAAYGLSDGFLFVPDLEKLVAQ